MGLYIGTKLVKAVVMSLGQYNNLRGWELPKNEEPHTEGYLVEYLDGGKPNTQMFEGYISWSPKDVFEKSYKATCSLDFGMALAALKIGKRVARQGWNGKGMWLSLSGPLTGRSIAYENFWSKNNSKYAMDNGGSASVLPCITMKTATGEILMGWLASQTDMLADDWVILEE